MAAPPKKTTKKHLNYNRSIGRLLEKWDSQDDNTVRAFNLLFQDTLGGDQNSEVVIGLQFTHNGRMISIDGDKEVQHLFFRERINKTEECEFIRYDLYSLGDEFIARYRYVSTIASDLQTSPTSVYNSVKHGLKIRGCSIKLIDLRLE
jgi:hypothetical protein